ncbi:MAG: GlsB/YeaQ/YmgE family stress response membrane protein [Sphingomonadales bacterium]|nr:GlsB/YeaQ/YmgE family stress response membrane protein [Sphingomonadales bacterium]
MSLLIILLVGANVGWLTSILLLVDRVRDVLSNVAIGIAGAFVCGVLASSVSLLEGITPQTLLASAIGAAALLLVVNLAALRMPQWPGHRVGHRAGHRR